MFSLAGAGEGVFFNLPDLSHPGAEDVRDLLFLRIGLGIETDHPRPGTIHGDQIFPCNPP